MVNNISVQEAHEKLEKQRLAKVKDKVILIDVREDWEYEQGHVQASQWIPLNELAEKAKEFDKTKEYLLMCKSGGRSHRGTQQLQQLGFEKVSNIEGGILAWAEEIDSTVTQSY